MTKTRQDFIIRSQLRQRGATLAGTQSIQGILNQQVDVFIDGAWRVVQAAAIASMDEITEQMIRSGSAEVSAAMVQLATAAKTRVNRKVGLTRLHEQAANDAHRAVLRSYDKRVGGHPHARYRENQGRLVGRMRRALERPDIIFAQRDGVVFGNTAVLDATAAHWRRLNFGAGQRGQRTKVKGEGDIGLKSGVDIWSGGNQVVGGTAARPSPLRLNNQVLRGAYLRWNNAGPSPAFSMPAGLWFDSGGGIVRPGKKHADDQFYPLGQALQKVAYTSSDASNRLARVQRRLPAFVSKKYPTQGIEGAQFLQAGLNMLVRGLPASYLNLAIGWIKEAADEAKPRGPIAAARVLR